MQAKELTVCPEPALLVREGRVAQMNEKARALLPGLAPGAPVPEGLALPEEESGWEGCAVLDGRAWLVRACGQEEGTLYRLSPMEQRALMEGQLDGALYQLRTLMHRFHREAQPYVAGERDRVEENDRAEFARDYYRMVRLMDHLDLLRDAADGQLHPRLEELELGTAAHRCAVECDGLLWETGIRVEYRGLPADVMIRGDAELLRTALLELISNSARRLKPGGTVRITLTKRGERALLCVTDDGPAATALHRAAMTGRGSLPRIPMGDSGAGLGLSVAEAIIRLHGGCMLIAAEEAAPRVWLTLPVTRRGPAASLPLRSPERNLGMSPYLIGLSDVLPGKLVLGDWEK